MIVKTTLSKSPYRPKCHSSWMCRDFPTQQSNYGIKTLSRTDQCMIATSWLHFHAFHIMILLRSVKHNFDQGNLFLKWIDIILFTWTFTSADKLFFAVELSYIVFCDVLITNCALILANIGGANRGSSKKSANVGTGKETLRLRSKGPAEVEVVSVIPLRNKAFGMSFFLVNM